jgi:gamma-glutamylcyclotransferase (GGCT)/AIG2-like uncharacterized protein YtfP
MADYVAVYGSLRKGMQAESKMERLEFVSQGVLYATLYALGWYPGIKFEANSNTTVVEVFKLPEAPLLREAILRDLDNYEGYNERNPQGSLFTRQTALVQFDEPFGREDFCYVYEYNHPTNRAPIVTDGDWLAYNTAPAT